MITKEDILNNKDWKELPNGNLTNKLYDDGYYPYSIEVKTNTYVLTLTKDKRTFREILPDSIQELDKNINKIKSYNPQESIKKDYHSLKHKIKTAKTYKDLYAR